MPKCCVVIPIHSASPSYGELVSFAQCFKVLNNYDIYVVHPNGIDLSKYTNVISFFNTKSIAPEWQASLVNYNRLKCSKYFYKLFDGYEYLLTYELDAYVFRDELSKWSDKGYDYIGAPWVEGWGKPVYPIQFIGVGNSGFSLRRIKSCIKIINRIVFLKRVKYLLESTSAFNFSFNSFLNNRLIKKLFKIRDIEKILKYFEIEYCAEDGFWAIWMGRMFSDFKIAPVKDAISFSFEAGAKDLYILNNNQLPFGCHAWLKYDPDFWSQYIPTDYSYNFTNCVNNNIKNAE